MQTWFLILLAAAGVIGFSTAGWLFLGWRQLPPRVGQEYRREMAKQRFTLVILLLLALLPLLGLLEMPASLSAALAGAYAALTWAALAIGFGGSCER